jgi:hypothetical protein
MASTINASSTGSGGLITTGDASGELALQANGVTKATVNASGLAMASNQTISTANTYGFKNRLINGRMDVNQYAPTSPVANINGTNFAIDRFQSFGNVASKFNTYQNYNGVTPPDGYSNYLGVQSTSAYSVATGDIFIVRQIIEGNNIVDLQWGTSGAKQVTASFWVRSSLTGTFGGTFYNHGTASSYAFTYSIPTANTWTYITITVQGQTSGGAMTAGTAASLQLIFGLGVGTGSSIAAGSWTSGAFFGATGATSVVGTNGATFYVTGVQLEVGSQATPFDFRSIGQELALCQRYLPAVSFAGGTNPYFGAGMAFSTTGAYFTVSFPVTPRVPPTGLTVSSATHFAGFLPSTATSNATSVLYGGADNHSAFVQFGGMSGLTAGDSTLIYMNNPNALMLFTGSEL